MFTKKRAKMARSGKLRRYKNGADLKKDGEMLYEKMAGHETRAKKRKEALEAKDRILELENGIGRSLVRFHGVWNHASGVDEGLSDVGKTLRALSATPERISEQKLRLQSLPKYGKLTPVCGDESDLRVKISKKKLDSHETAERRAKRIMRKDARKERDEQRKRLKKGHRLGLLDRALTPGNDKQIHGGNKESGSELQDLRPLPDLELVLLDVKTVGDPNTRSRSILRTLLRECTYLPDPWARIYMRSHILQSFKNYMDPHSNDLDSMNEHSDEQERLRRNFAKAQKGIKTLYRANAGHMKDLTEVLLIAWGRTGRRRHELLSKLKAADPTYKDAISRAVDGHNMPPELALKVPRLSRQLEVLLHSQKTKNPTILTRGINPRSTNPTLEKLNAKKRPVSLERVGTQLRNWYGKVMARLLPPIEPHEWHFLGQLACGKVKFTLVRPRARPKGFELGSTALLEALQVVEVYEPNLDKDRAHQLTQRFMQRLWARIFKMCPLMEYDAIKDDWTVQWGAMGKTRTEDGFERTYVGARLLEIEEKDTDEKLKRP